MRRWLFHITAAISLLLLVATAGAWMYSLGHQLELLHGLTKGQAFSTGSSWQLRLSAQLDLTIQQMEIAPATPKDGWKLEVPGFLALRVSRAFPMEGTTYVQTIIAVKLSYWLASLLLAILPALWTVLLFRRWRRGKRPSAGLCLSCGYNLTGNVSGVCPECGTAIPPAAGGGQRAAKEGSA